MGVVMRSCRYRGFYFDFIDCSGIPLSSHSTLQLLFRVLFYGEERRRCCWINSRHLLVTDCLPVRSPLHLEEHQNEVFWGSLSFVRLHLRSSPIWFGKSFDFLPTLQQSQQKRLVLLLLLLGRHV